MTIVEKISALAVALEQAGLPYGLGGALALAYCTGEPRGTVDIDVNIFVDVGRAAEVVAALPSEVEWTEEDVELLLRDGQCRLWWERTPLDLFLDTTPYHREASERRVRHEFAGRPTWFLGCSDLAVFKAFFNRSKDWVDLEEMLRAGTLDRDGVVGVLVRYLGVDDERVTRLLDLDRSMGEVGGAGEPMPKVRDLLEP